MSASGKVLKTATFNPGIKRYIFIGFSVLLFITGIGIFVLIFWLLGVGQWYSRKYYESLQCVLTEKRLEFKKGHIFKVSKTIPLENIQDLTFIENPILNYFGLKIIKIETAGSSGNSGADMRLIGIEEADDFKKSVLDQRELLLSNKASGIQSPMAFTEPDNAALLMEIRDLLREIRDGRKLN